MLEHFTRRDGVIKMSAEAAVAFDFLGGLQLSIPHLAALIAILDVILAQADDGKLSGECAAGCLIARDVALVMVATMSPDLDGSADLKRQLLRHEKPLNAEVFALFPILADTSLLADAASASLNGILRRH